MHGQEPDLQLQQHLGASSPTERQPHHPYQLTAWQLQSVYAVLKAIEHPGMMRVQEVSPRQAAAVAVT